MKIFKKQNKWILVNDVNQNNVIVGRKWICSVCKYTGLHWSLLVEKIRGGIPYEKPIYKFCPNCGKKLDSVW